MSRYAIWDKQSNIITPIGENLTPEQWIERYPVAGIPSIKFVCGGGVINGSFAGEFTSMVETYAKAGCDFSHCTFDQHYLDAIEAFEDAQNAAPTEASVEERTAAALEFIAMSSLPDETAE